MRVIEYGLDGIADAEPLYRLITTLLDPESAPAAELAALYHERWEQEGAFAELKVTLPGGQLMLRSRRPTWPNRNSMPCCSSTWRCAG